MCTVSQPGTSSTSIPRFYKYVMVATHSAEEKSKKYSLDLNLCNQNQL